jgi:hypothetical protein
MHLKHGPPDHPVHGIREASIGGVVSGDILQVPNRGVETAPPIRIDITKPDTAGSLKYPTNHRFRRECGGTGFGHGRHRIKCDEYRAFEGLRINSVDEAAAVRDRDRAGRSGRVST